MTICGTSTGVFLSSILKDFSKNIMIDGVVVCCLFLVVGYRQYLREHRVAKNLTYPTIAQILLVATALGPRRFVYSPEASKVIDNYCETLTKQAEEATLSRLTSFMAKQPTQILRISALTQILELIPIILQNINLKRTNDDKFGLNIRLYREVTDRIQQMFGSQIIITEASTTRAIYFHGYLLEQTLKLFDTNPLEKIRKNNITWMEKNMDITICREILKLPVVIITKENFYSSSDYFIITSTKRPIECFAKKLPENEDEQENLCEKLKVYNIELSEYVSLSRSIGIQALDKLSTIGIQLFSKPPYNSLYDLTSTTKNSLSNKPLSSSISIDYATRTTTIPLTTMDQCINNTNRNESETRNVFFRHNQRSSRCITLRSSRNNRNNNNSSRQDGNTTDDTDAIILD
ncbi:unnamed protein product [Rotaria sp. Silwood2]|nr:unnamed protein product [Rotaria sp. Silwood2]